MENHEGLSGLRGLRGPWQQQANGAGCPSGLVDNRTDAEGWMAAIARRNMTSHVYNSVILQETIDFIRDGFHPLVNAIHGKLSQKL